MQVKKWKNLPNYKIKIGQFLLTWKTFLWRT